jgi:hypothetical protein
MYILQLVRFILRPELDSCGLGEAHGNALMNYAKGREILDHLNDCHVHMNGATPLR